MKKVLRHIHIASVKKKRNKYNAVRTVVEGETCDSKIEAEHYKTLLAAQRGGAISGLKLHPRYTLHVAGEKLGVCVLDFEFMEDGKMCYVDVKGVYTDYSRWKHRHFTLEYGREVEIWKKEDSD